MGYYTRYEIELVGEPGESFFHALGNAENDLGLAVSSAFDDGEDHWNPFDDYDVKWYDHEDDMRKVSKKFPDTVFQLSGEGEEAGDIWIKYFKGGKMQHCPVMMSFDEYDESKLE